MNPSLLPQLQTFLVVARLRSFTAAARERGVSTPAVSQAVKQLEEHLGVALLTRTTRSVSLTDEGRRLAEAAGPPLEQTLSALTRSSAPAGEVVGRLRLSVPQGTLRYVIAPVLQLFRERHPRIDVEIVAEDRFVDIVAEGYDAGIRVHEAIERDMVQVRMSKPFRFIIIASPRYLASRGTPERPEELLRHDCLTFRSANGALYAWELQRGKRTWRVAVRGGIVTNSTLLRLLLVEQGVGLTYVPEPMVDDTALRDGRLVRVLEPYATTAPGFFIYYPSRAQSSPALRLFVAAARELVGTAGSPVAQVPAPRPPRPRRAR